MPALVLCKSCGWTEAKEIPLPPPPSPIITQNSLFGWKEAFETDTNTHTHTSAFPVTCLLLAVPPSLGAGAAETPELGRSRPLSAALRPNE